MSPGRYSLVEVGAGRGYGGVCCKTHLGGRPVDLLVADLVDDGEEGGGGWEPDGGSQGERRGGGGAKA